MRVRVLVEQRPDLHGINRLDGTNAPYLASGEEYDLEDELARSLLADGHAELIDVAG